MGDELERGPVGPVKIVEGEDQWPARRQVLEQRAHRSVRPEALGRGARVSGSGVERAKGGKHPGELAEVLGREPLVGPRVERLQVLVEGVDHDAEGKLPLEFGRAALKRQATAPSGAVGQVGQQSRLADPGLACDEQEAGLARTCPLEQLLDELKLTPTAHHGPGHVGHFFECSDANISAPVRCDGSDQGIPPIPNRLRLVMLKQMPRFMLEHRHTAAECGAVFAAFNASESPLRHQEATASCHYGGHRIWWEVEAETEDEAMARLPGYVAHRTRITQVRWTEIP